MNTKLLTEHHLEFLSLKGGYTGSSEYINVKMPHCWKSHVAAHLCYMFLMGCGFKPYWPHCVVSLRARHVNPSLVLVQPRKTHPDIADKLSTGM